jgi:hypothetical protein
MKFAPEQCGSVLRYAAEGKNTRANSGDLLSNLTAAVINRTLASSTECAIRCNWFQQVMTAD